MLLFIIDPPCVQSHTSQINISRTNMVIDPRVNIYTMFANDGSKKSPLDYFETNDDLEGIKSVVTALCAHREMTMG